MFDPWVGEITGRRKWQHTLVFFLGKFHGQRSLAGYSAWGCKEPDTTEHTHWADSTRISHAFNKLVLDLV